MTISSSSASDAPGDPSPADPSSRLPQPGPHAEEGWAALWKDGLRTARRMSRPGDDAEDLLQEALALLLHRQRDGLVPADPAKCGGWLAAVIRTLAHTRRRAAARAARTLQQASHSMADPSPRTPSDEDPAGQAIAAEMADRLGQEVARLPRRFRDPIVLVRMRGLSVAEAADELGRPTGTVAAQIHRATAILRRRMTRWADPTAMAGLPAFALFLAPPPTTAAAATTTGGSILSTIQSGGLVMKGSSKILSLVAVLMLLAIVVVLTLFLLEPTLFDGQGPGDRHASADSDPGGFGNPADRDSEGGREEVGVAAEGDDRENRLAGDASAGSDTAALADGASAVGEESNGNITTPGDEDEAASNGIDNEDSAVAEPEPTEPEAPRAVTLMLTMIGTRTLGSTTSEIDLDGYLARLDATGQEVTIDATNTATFTHVETGTPHTVRLFVPGVDGVHPVHQFSVVIGPDAADPYRETQRWLQRNVPITGIVVGPDGEPLTGERVQLHPIVDGQPRPMLHGRATDRDGRFSLQSYHPINEVSWVDSTGEVIETRRIDIGNGLAGGIRFVAARWVTWQLRLERAGGSAVADRLLDVFLLWEPTATGANGGVSINLSPAQVRVTVRALGAADPDSTEGARAVLQQWRLTATPDEIEAGRVERTLVWQSQSPADMGRAEIRVTGPDGAPVEGASTFLQAVATQAGDPVLPQQDYDQFNGETDANGIRLFDEIYPGRYRVTVRHREFGTADRMIEIPVGGRVELPITMSPDGWVVLHLETDEGPLPSRHPMSLELHLTRTADGTEPSIDNPVRAHSGVYRRPLSLGDLESGATYEIRLAVEGYEPATVTVPAEPRADADRSARRVMLTPAATE